MRNIPPYLNDEHMQLYEWNGAGIGMQHDLQVRTQTRSSWHASYAVLALLTSLLVLNGCDSKRPAETAAEKSGQIGEDPSRP